MDKKEYARWYRETHKEQARERTKRWNQSERGKELNRKRSAKYRKENVEACRRRCRDWEIRNRVVRRAYARRRSRGIKTEVLTHYGNGRCTCVKCGMVNLACLTIDHIEAGGAKQRKGIQFGAPFYLSLKKGNYPTGYQTLCMNCQFIKREEKGEWF